ncbi:MAG: rRNA maturation RNase YbeY [Pseudomonadota bacterium]
MTFEILIEDGRWSALDLETLAVQSCAAVLRCLDVAQEAEISLLACDDTRIAALNADFRGKPAPTNVLSWPAEALAPDQPGARPPPPRPDPDGALCLGDIAIAWETCHREALDANKPLADHVSHLIVHGVLHLLGFDHVDDADAAQMEALEIEILAGLGKPNPYIVSGGSQRP